MNSMPFNVRDCTLIMRMGGVEPAANMRELRERVAVCPTESLFHHFCETVIRPTFDDPEFRNDFAVWSAHSLNDRVLAERLGIINPYALSSFEELREIVIDILDERLSEVPFVQWALGGDFRFMQAATVVFDSDIDLVEPSDLVEQLPNMSHSSIYYHFVEARRRTPDGSDDFTVWLQDFGESTEPMRAAMASIDFYHLTLSQLKDKATSALRRVEIPEVKHDS
ncbi:hypothetical protein GF356_01310 [candidate division GN15 bacterium]|nr:hypothetical protein [candidate division GN15 bacterium]